MITLGLIIDSLQNVDLISWYGADGASACFYVNGTGLTVFDSKGEQIEDQIIEG
jgi:hypothetical protein